MRQLIKLFALTAICLFVAVASFAQVTTSSMSGKITDVDGSTVAGATVVAIHTPSGSQYYSITDNNGLYRIQNMRPGGPYTIEVSLLGFGTNTQKGIELMLAENFVHNVQLKEESIMLDELVVAADGATSTMKSERAGSVTSLNMTQMNAIPTVSRDLEGFVKMTPQSFNSGNGPQIGGGTYRENNFTIDGASMNNAFGIGQSMPAGGSPISLDAIDQISINVTPFDVRQSGFLGGSMNATTRSGSNQFVGSAYMYYYNEGFRGKKTSKGELSLSEESNLIYGFTVGGPIVKDKLFFFVNAEFEKVTAPGPSRVASTASNPYTDGSNGVARPKAEVLDALSNFLATKYGYNTGAYQGYSSDSPGYKVLARLDWNIHKNHKLSLRYNTTNKKNPSNPSTSTSGLGDRYWLSGNRTNMSAVYYQNARYFQEQNYHSFSGELNSRFADGAVNNLLRVTYSHQDEPRSTEGGLFPFVDIGVEGKYYTSFGTELFSYGNLRDVKTLTVTDELTWSKGINLFTFGLQYEHNQTKNGFQRFGAGYYTFGFDSEQDLMNAIGNGTLFNNPHQYAITHSFNDDFSQAFPTFNFNQFSIYLQDELNISDRFKLTAGLRFEIPSYPNLDTFNEAIYNVPMADYKYDMMLRGDRPLRQYSTAQLPQTKLMVSPRIGFNWDVLGNRKFILRGGTGFFTGRLPFVWIVAQAGDANVLQTTYTAVEGQNKVIPNFTGNREQDLAQIYPQGPSSAAAALPSSCSLMAPDLKMPQTWKTSLAADVKLPGGFIGSLEGIFNYDINPVKIDNIALKDPEPETNGTNDNRWIWGSGVKNTYADAYNSTMYNAYLLRNAEKNGRYFSLTAKLEKTYWKGLSGMIAYTYSTAKSLGDGFGDQMYSAWMNAYTVNGNNIEELAAPSYVMPHRLIANLSYGINYGKNFRTSVALFYEGGPQGRVSYTYTSSVVNDGGANNLIYVPKSQNELKFSDYTYTDASGVKQTYTASAQATDFWNFVNNNSYLKTRKGQYAERNGLVYPWVHQFDLKITQDFYIKTRSGNKNTLSVGLDIKNLGNLLCKDWGNKQSFTVASILKQTNRRLKVGEQEPVYQFQRYGTEVLKDAFAPTFGTSSTYLMQLTVRYSFN